jgi:AcrR family transcriptional regulator
MSIRVIIIERKFEMTKSEENLSARQLQAIETRHRLLKAGRTIFLKHGFQKSTISQVIKEANTGYGTAYVYFKNKDDLLIVLMDELMEEFYKVAELTFQPRTKNEAFDMIAHQVRLFLTLSIKEREIMRVIKEAIGVSTEVEHKWEMIRARFIQRIAKDVTFAQEKLLAKQHLNPLLVAKGWFYSNEMFMWEIVHNDITYSIDEVIEHLTAIYTSGLYK